MTTQDWVIIGAGWLALAIIHIGVLWDQHHATRRADRHRTELTKLRKRLLHVEAAQRGLPTTAHAPMNDKIWSGSMTTLATMGGVPKVTATISGDRSLQPHTTYDRQRCTQDADQTLRLARPPALSDVEGVLHLAGRDLTATEMATQLDRRPWDLLPDIDHLVRAGKIETVPGHTAGRTAYRLADNLRMVAR